jgi:tRNA A-37 threonylcarbamoyl transferase component Bud32
MANRTCPHCGATTEAEARFCGICGGRLLPAAAPAAPVPAPGPAGLAGLQATQIADKPALPVPVPDPRSIPSPALARAAPATAAPAATPTPAPNGADAPAATPPPARVSLENLVGRTLNGRYLVERKIGEGGFGAVFKAKQVATGREVALKVLHPHNVMDATVVARFRREAEACSKLTNPHTVTIYDFDETEDGILYLAMELLRGKSLQQLEREEGPLEPIRVMRILDQVGEALGEAHALGIVHRDMKPENVMIESRFGDDFVKVLDFGIAKIVEQSGKAVPALTAIGQTLGTLEFMSPEQLRGRTLDGRSDIYALGMMAYEALTGELPFKSAQSSTEVIQFHLQTPAPPPSSLRPDLKIPDEVDQVVLKMVAKKRDDRHADAAELSRQIQEVLSTIENSATRHEALRVVAVVGGLALLVTAIIVLASL